MCFSLPWSRYSTHSVVNTLEAQAKYWPKQKNDYIQISFFIDRVHKSTSTLNGYEFDAKLISKAMGGLPDTFKRSMRIEIAFGTVAEIWDINGVPGKNELRSVYYLDCSGHPSSDMKYGSITSGTLYYQTDTEGFVYREVRTPLPFN